MAINHADLVIGYYRRAGDPLNRTDVAVHVAHIPTGVWADCAEHQTRHANQKEALKKLKAMLALPRRAGCGK